MSADHHHNSAEHVPHILPLKVYFGVAGALICLTLITVLTAQVNLEHWFTLAFEQSMGYTPNPEGPAAYLNIVLAMFIATIKATLVCMFFMHLKYDNKFNSVALISALFALAIFFILVFTDTLTRDKKEGEITPPNLVKVKAIDKAHGSESKKDDSQKDEKKSH